VTEAEPSVDWVHYPRVEPGSYSAYCKHAKWYFDPGFKRWTCIVRFEVFQQDDTSSLGVIPLWLNGGRGKGPATGRRSKYFEAWIHANGGPPSREDRLSPRIFMQRRAKVTVSDTVGIAPYSVVQRIDDWLTGGSLSQLVTQSTEAGGKGKRISRLQELSGRRANPKDSA
jgi:hypothetical protein